MEVAATESIVLLSLTVSPADPQALVRVARTTVMNVRRR